MNTHHKSIHPHFIIKLDPCSEFSSLLLKHGRRHWNQFITIPQKQLFLDSKIKIKTDTYFWFWFLDSDRSDMILLIIPLFSHLSH